MPLYDYTCDQCADTTERAYRWPPPEILDDPCRVCGGTVGRRPSAPAFAVKGFNAANGYSTKEKK